MSERTHKTKAIVLRSVKFGDTSLIVTAYTELFGIQSYMVKGARKTNKQGASKANYFEPASILDLVVYHNDLKTLQFIQSQDWGYVYQQLKFDVLKNSVALYLIELVQHCLRQPEANAELYLLIEDNLRLLDRSEAAVVANLPLYFSLQLAAELGFQIHGSYDATNCYLDLEEGVFCQQPPTHFNFLEAELAAISSQLLNIPFYEALANIQLNQTQRRKLLNAYQIYFAHHIAAFGKLKTVEVLGAIF
jgi:DNA repair protein RecO (recombination protein O)